MKYQQCPLCGSSLDFGETCHCADNAENIEKEPISIAENSSKTKTNKKLPYLHYSTNSEKGQDEPEEKFNAEKAVEAQRTYCSKHHLTNFAPALDGTCFYCGKNIYEPVTQENGRVTGYTVAEAGKRHIFFCPHCHADFLD